MLKTFITALIVVVEICSGMCAMNFISRAPTNFNSCTTSIRAIHRIRVILTQFSKTGTLFFLIHPSLSGEKSMIDYNRGKLTLQINVITLWD